MKTYHVSVNTNRGSKLIALTVFFAIITGLANAQNWSVSKKTVSMSTDAIVYIESAYQRGRFNDTLTGTAFLIADNAKVYLVTAKHIVVAALTGENQQLGNNSIFLSTTWKSEDKGMKITGLSDWSIRKRPYVFSSDKEDIAIISFQKKPHKKILATILKQGCKPISIKSIDITAHRPGDSFFLPAYTTFKNEEGIKVRSKGISPAIIKTFNPTSTAFTTNYAINQSNNGAPIILNNKIIGVLSNGNGITNTAFHTTESATATKASRIIALLRKLQQNENMPGFN